MLPTFNYTRPLPETYFDPGHTPAQTGLQQRLPGRLLCPQIPGPQGFKRAYGLEGTVEEFHSGCKRTAQPPDRFERSDIMGPAEAL